METLRRARQGASVKVCCSRCGDIGVVTDRQARRKLEEGKLHLCRLCREIKVKPPTQADYNYWLKRFTAEEIVDMGRAIWG